MARRIMQRICECSECGIVPNDGENLWAMDSGGYLCEICIDKEADEDEESNELTEIEN